MKIQDLYKYSWFSALAYVDWRRRSNLTPTEAIEDANSAQRVPGIAGGVIDTLGERIFSPTTDGGEGWTVADHQANDADGFAASLFIKAGITKGVSLDYFLIQRPCPAARASSLPMFRSTSCNEASIASPASLPRRTATATSAGCRKRLPTGAAPSTPTPS